MFIHTNQPLITSFYLKKVPIFCRISDESAGQPGSADVEERLTKKRPHPESEILYNVVRKKPKLKYAPRGKNISNYKFEFLKIFKRIQNLITD